MRLVISTIAILSLICTLASCARGGNIDKGHDGYIGKDHDDDDVIVTTNEPDDMEDNGIIPDGTADINDNNSNDRISGRMDRSLDGFDPQTLIPDGIRR